MKKLEIAVKDNYGKTTFYPQCEDSLIFARIAGTKTLTEYSLKLIKQLGYEINFTYPTINI